MLFAPHLSRCFGRGDEDERDACPCPDSCWELCGQVRFDYKRSPRHERGRGKYRPYTPIPNDIIGVWGPPGEPEPSDSVKFTYLLLIRRTSKPRPRWVLDSMADLARMRGCSVKTFRRHCTALKRLDLIQTVPYRLLSEAHNMNEHAIVLLDLPDWYRTPQDVGGPSAQPEEDFDDEEGDDDIDGLVTDARPSQRRREVDIEKVRRHRAALRRRRTSDAA